VKDNVILFDLDDTLVVEYASAQEAFSVACEYAVDYGISQQILMKDIQAKARELWYSMPTFDYCMKIGISSWEGLWADFTGEDVNIKQLYALKKEYQTKSWHLALLESGINDIGLAEKLSLLFRAERRKRHILCDFALETLRTLSRDFRLGLITNGAPDLQNQKIRGAGIEHFFDHIIISGEVGVGKPDKKIFDTAFLKFNSNQEKFIMVGDSIRSDISGAKNAGIKSIWLNKKSKKSDSDVQIDSIIEDLSQLPEKVYEIFSMKPVIG
jgi:putative hydrolase of the HAD superfamily